MNENKTAPRSALAVAVYDDQARARQVVEALIEADFPMDRISLLGRAGGSGDDMLGVSFSQGTERIKAWGKQGALWGALWGALAGAAGLFVLPGLGPVLAAGPVVEAIGGAISGAALAGGAMAGAAVLSELASALHRLGIPEQHLQALHDAVRDGHYLVILQCNPEEVEDCAGHLRRAAPLQILTLPIWY
ncbi:hypothetical protein QVG61_04405 [Thiohalobacter sp. IOR34]|uniref:hypothetical protein n=1 Tax=Thiohalobacter sp. IOR34 TaxID=3057176 RepID=UPI0025B27730|nr:hypothetical protein [Thiohalobacter sp. IOR34]WJW76342.1 hypothetical protein QVG61_04405 [Thiohalobacter sp. IOR34]